MEKKEEKTLFYVKRGKELIYTHAYTKEEAANKIGYKLKALGKRKYFVNVEDINVHIDFINVSIYRQTHYDRNGNPMVSDLIYDYEKGLWPIYIDSKEYREQGYDLKVEHEDIRGSIKRELEKIRRYVPAKYAPYIRIKYNGKFYK